MILAENRHHPGVNVSEGEKPCQQTQMMTGGRVRLLSGSGIRSPGAVFFFVYPGCFIYMTFEDTKIFFGRPHDFYAHFKHFTRLELPDPPDLSQDIDLPRWFS